MFCVFILERNEPNVQLPRYYNNTFLKIMFIQVKIKKKKNEYTNIIVWIGTHFKIVYIILSMLSIAETYIFFSFNDFVYNKFYFRY